MFLRASVGLWSSEQLLVSFPNLHNFNEFCARRISGTTRSYFSERNSVSFPESIESEKGWRFDILCTRSPGVKGICADALLCDSLSCQSLRFVVEARYSTEPIQ